MVKVNLNRLLGTQDEGKSGYKNSVNLHLTMAVSSQTISATLYAGDRHGYNTGSLNSPFFGDLIRQALYPRIECDNVFSYKMGVNLNAKQFKVLVDELYQAFKASNEKHGASRIEIEKNTIAFYQSDLNLLIDIFTNLKLTAAQYEKIYKAGAKTRRKKKEKVDVDELIFLHAK